MDKQSVRNSDVFERRVRESVDHLESAEATLQEEYEDGSSTHSRMIADAKRPLTRYLETSEVKQVETAADELDQLYDSTFEELDDHEHSLTHDIWIARVEVQEAVSQIEMRPFQREIDTTVEMSSDIDIDIGMLKAKIERLKNKIDPDNLDAETND